MRVSAAVQRCSDKPTRLSSATLFCCRSLMFLFAVGLRSSYSVFLCVFPVSCVSVALPEHMHNRCSDCCHSPRHHIRGVAARLCRNSSETRFRLFYLLCSWVSSIIFFVILWPAFLFRSLQSSRTLTDKLCHSSHSLTEATPLSSAHNYRAE